VLPLPYTNAAAALGLLIANAFGLAGEWRLMRERRREAGQPRPQDSGSASVVEAATALSMSGALLTGWLLPSAAIASMRVPLYLAGIASIVAGGLLRRHCFAMLGPRFTYIVRATADQKVVERGAYKYVRHPSYAAGLLWSGGVGLALGNWASLVVSVVPLAAAYGYRIAVEERALAQTIGPAYLDYMKRTHRLIPFVL
jgi:protein-S-isoprenylcysteine O-methyltransferase Ste14